MGGTAKPYTKEGVLNKEHFISIKNGTVFEDEAKKAALYVKDVLSSNGIEPNIYIPSYSTQNAYNVFVDALAVNKDNAIMVGDSDNDVLAGQQAGIKTVFCSFGYSELHKSKSDFTINSPIELLDIII